MQALLGDSARPADSAQAAVGYLAHTNFYIDPQMAGRQFFNLARDGAMEDLVGIKIESTSNHYCHWNTMRVEHEDDSLMIVVSA